jgi:hypothetical protein
MLTWYKSATVSTTHAATLLYLWYLVVTCGDRDHTLIFQHSLWYVLKLYPSLIHTIQPKSYWHNQKIKKSIKTNLFQMCIFGLREVCALPLGVRVEKSGRF